jgi:hypothetical protein
MPISQRLLLILGAIAILTIIVRSVRAKRILIEDSLFWIMFSLLLVILGLFPQIAFFFASFFGFQSPANLVFLVVVGILLIKEFRNTAKISLLKEKVNQLAQEIALQNKN